MPYMNNNAPGSPVKPMVITSYDFNSKMISGSVQCPKIILRMLENEAFSGVPKNATVRETRNSTIVELENKRMTISAWLVSTADINSKPFKQLSRENYDVALVTSIHFYDNGKFVSVCDECDSKIVVGLYSKYLKKPSDLANVANNSIRKEYDSISTLDDAKVNYFASHYVRPLARAASKAAYDFFMPEDILVDQAIEWLKDNDPSIEINRKSVHSFLAEFKLNDYDVSVAFKSDKDSDSSLLSFTIYHQYDDTDRAYGAKYADTRKDFSIKSLDDLNAINYKELMDYLWEKRNGTCIRRGSLGT